MSAPSIKQIIPKRRSRISVPSEKSDGVPRKHHERSRKTSTQSEPPSRPQVDNAKAQIVKGIKEIRNGGNHNEG